MEKISTILNFWPQEKYRLSKENHCYKICHTLQKCGHGKTYNVAEKLLFRIHRNAVKRKIKNRMENQEILLFLQSYNAIFNSTQIVMLFVRYILDIRVWEMVKNAWLWVYKKVSLLSNL